jgi:phosphoglycerate dehydrogenase-like enzyme
MPEERVAELRAAHPSLEIASAATPEEFADAVADADAVFGYGLLSPEALRAATKLHWIHSPSEGVEWMAKYPELVESDVMVTNARGAFSATIGEHAFALLLFLTRGLRQLDALQQQRQWARPTGIPMFGLSGLTMGVVGLGKIGSAIAQRAHGFDMKVIAVDANDVPRPDYVSEFRLLDGLPDLLRKSDVVAVAAPITPETRGMLGPAQLALLKPTAYLIVVSRGGIVDEPTLISMLKEGKLAGAGLDVAAREPLPPDDPLWGAPNLVITPHCSPASRQTAESGWAIFRDNLARFLAGEPMATPVDKRRGY